jgi:hypothetical protein
MSGNPSRMPRRPRAWEPLDLDLLEYIARAAVTALRERSPGAPLGETTPELWRFHDHFTPEVALNLIERLRDLGG